MERRISFGLAISLLMVLATSLFMFGTVRSADAISITQGYYIELDGYGVNPTTYESDAIAGLKSLGSMAGLFGSDLTVGTKRFGSIIYDNANIPASGNYVIGQSDWRDSAGPWSGPNEYQSWYPPIIVAPASVFPEVHFMDGKITGIYAENHADVWGGLEGEILSGTNYSATGNFLYYHYDPDQPEWGPIDHWADFSIRGTLHFIATPEPVTVLLLGLGIVGLVGYSRKSRISKKK